MRSPWRPSWRLQLGGPGLLVWALGSGLALTIAILAGDVGAFFGPYYLLSLVLFAGVVGGEPARSIRRWLSPDGWSATSAVFAAYLPRILVAVGGLVGAALVLGLLGDRALSPADLARTTAILVAATAQATLLSTILPGWFNVATLLATEGLVLWWWMHRELEGVARWAAIIFCPPLSAEAPGTLAAVAVPATVAAGCLLLAVWRIARTEVSP